MPTTSGIGDRGSGIRRSVANPRSPVPDPRIEPPSGFGLIEAIIATAILVVGVVAVAQVFALGTRAMAAAREMTYETVLAMQKLEELRAGSFPEGPADLQEMVDLRGETLPDGADVARAAYRRRWTVEPWPFDLVDAVVVTVTVTRPIAMGPPVRLTALRTRRPS